MVSTAFSMNLDGSRNKCYERWVKWLEENKKYLDRSRKNSDQLMNELELISAPLVEYLKNNFNPHCRIEIDSTSIKVVEDVIGIPIRELSKEFDERQTEGSLLDRYEFINGLAIPKAEPFALQPKHIKYTSNFYVGEASKDISIEGSIDDVLKVLATLK